MGWNMFSEDTYSYGFINIFWITKGMSLFTILFHQFRIPNPEISFYVTLNKLPLNNVQNALIIMLFLMGKNVFLFFIMIGKLLNYIFDKFSMLFKVQLFWVNIKTMRKIAQIFVAFSEKLNFRESMKLYSIGLISQS